MAVYSPTVSIEQSSQLVLWETVACFYPLTTLHVVHSGAACTAETLCQIFFLHLLRLIFRLQAVDVGNSSTPTG